MKQKALLVIAAIMAATLSFTACSDDKDDDTNEN